MRILYISSTEDGMLTRSIYYDLLKEFEEQGHDVTIAYASKSKTKLFTENGMDYLRIKTMNMVKNTNLIEKGIATLIFDSTLSNSIKSHLKGSFDMILYSTPPITITSTLKMLRKAHPKAFFYLMLKDIFPQNAIDIDIIKKGSFLHKFFLKKERKIYAYSDVIGVMSQANKKFILDYDPNLKSKVHILPNTISLDTIEPELRRSDFNLPSNKKLLLYGGNLGLPQSVPYILECYKTIENDPGLAMVIAGRGAMDHLIKDYIQIHKPTNLFYFDHMPQSRYDNLVASCDIGLIFLDYRFTVPNFPQRLLSYLSKSMPVVCATDKATDIGRISQDNGFGYAVASNDVKEWYDTIKTITQDLESMKSMGIKGYEYLKNNFTSEIGVGKILTEYNKFKGE